MNKKLGTKWKLNRAIQNELNNLTILRTSNNNATNSNSNLANNNNNIVVNNITQPVNLELENLNHTVELPCEPTELNTIYYDNFINTTTIEHQNTYTNFINTENNDEPRNKLFDNLSLTEQVIQHLKLWAVKNRITHLALKELLQIISLVPELKNIPKDPRIFLNTPRTTITRHVSPGSYFHLGIMNGLNSMFKHIDLINIPNIIEVSINIDGLPLFKSSSSQFYPILCIVNNVKIQPNIFPIGIYHGSEKPNDFNDMLSDFVNESLKLTTDGLIIKNKHTKFKITMFLFDAVAKASILFIKGHSGYSSCTKCSQEGEYFCGRVCFPDLNFTKRTDLDFLAKTDSDHHTGTSILEKIPGFRPVTDVPLDYMHLICLGVVKKFVVNTWCFGRPPHKLAAREINIMSDTLISFTKFVPVEFARVPRSLKESKRWKATEFRQFLLYTGPIVLKRVLHNTKYDHFISLHIASIILLSEKYQLYTDYAEELLTHFVLSTKHLYGPEFLTHNIHNLLHIASDVKEFGNMNLFSNFPAENYLQKLKKLVRNSHHVLPQVVRRLSEENAQQTYLINDNEQTLNSYKLERENINNDGILISGTNNPQFKRVIFSNFKLTLNKKNSCCKLFCNSIVEIYNFAFSPSLNKNVIIGKKYNTAVDFYEKPCKSSLFDIYYVDNLNNEFTYWPITDICCKLARFPYKSGFVVFPLLHTI